MDDSKNPPMFSFFKKKPAAPPSTPAPSDAPSPAVSHGAPAPAAPHTPVVPAATAAVAQPPSPATSPAPAPVPAPPPPNSASPPAGASASPSAPSHTRSHTCAGGSPGSGNSCGTRAGGSPRHRCPSTRFRTGSRPHGTQGLAGSPQGRPAQNRQQHHHGVHRHADRRCAV